MDQGASIEKRQIRAARALLGWSQGQLAKVAGVSIPTIKRAEGNAAVAASEQSLAAIRAALEKAGVLFIEENGGGPGVRLRKDAEAAGETPPESP